MGEANQNRLGPAGSAPTTKKTTGVQQLKERMQQARAGLPKGVGQQAVIQYVVRHYPALDSLMNVTRWRNAWQSKVSDLEITEAVESASAYYQQQQNKTRTRLSRQKLSK